jgi:hypothetical protein
MVLQTMSAFDLFVLLPLAGWLVVAALGCYCVYDCVQSLKPPPPLDWRPNVVLIIPVRGVPPNFHALWEAIRAQRLAPSRIVFALEDKNDPAFAAITALPPGPRRDCVIAGPASGRGQKVHNLLAALETLAADDAVIVFADADIVPEPDWLVRLVTPLRDSDIKLVSGYRWMTPMDERWSSAFVSAANASIATLPRAPVWNIPWGGSIALTRETLVALELPVVWERSLPDDLPLGLAARAQGLPVTCPQSLLVPSPTTMSWREAFAFGRRQYLFARWYSPKHWLLAAAGTTLPLIGWAVALPLAVTGSTAAFATIVVANTLDQVRASLRARVPRELWGAEMPRRMALLDRFATPAVLAFHAAIVWSTLFGRSMAWAGRRYRLDSGRRVTRIDAVAS